MSNLTPAQLQKLHELLADEMLDQLSFDDRIELDDLLARGGAAHAGVDVVGELVARVGKGKGALPPVLKAKLQSQGERIVAGHKAVLAPAPQHTRPPVVVSAQTGKGGTSRSLPWLLAASLALAGGLGYLAWNGTNAARSARRRALDYEAQILKVRGENSELLAAAQKKADDLARVAAAAESRASTLEKDLASKAAREVRLAQDLAQATSKLDAATLRIAKFEAPQDPAELAARRTKLMEVPGTIRVAWSNFDLPDAPAEQQKVTGDVVWSDELEQGYLRFVGLKPNDPKVEQYQVWVIDERGMEQKVSGGVFNASAAGEIVVPIAPGIDMRRVQLFAITIEEPGGTWVPSLKRRVVVAPRS